MPRTPSGEASLSKAEISLVTALLGVIPRECPSAPLGELLFEVQPCKSDAECWPRVCCPDGRRSYCRTARARLDLVPVARQIDAREFLVS